MLQFLQENITAIIYLVIMTIVWFLIQFFSIKGDVDTLDKKRVAKGMTAMTDDEKQLLKQTLRSSTIHNSLQVIIAGIVSLLVVTLLF